LEYLQAQQFFLEGGVLSNPGVLYRFGPTNGRELPSTVVLSPGPLLGCELIERVLARTSSAALVGAILEATQTEHPDRRITLGGAWLIADTTE
jgi:hypothetical protein